MDNDSRLKYDIPPVYISDRGLLRGDIMRKIVSPLLIVLLMFMVASCATTQLTNLWKDPSYSAPPLKKIMVVAFRRNQINRRMWEDAVVTGFSTQKSAATVVPSYQLFPDAVPESDAVQEMARDQEFDGVLIVSKVERNTLTSEVPGYTTSEPVTQYSRRWKTYITRYEEVYHAGYTDTSKVISVRTDLLLTRGADGQLVWSATSKSVDPTSRTEFRASVASLVARQLTKAHLIP